MTRIPNEWRYFDDKLGIPYPWYTRPCLEFLEMLDFRRKEIFEYGAGNSTTWYRSKGAIVKGVDSDIDYADRFKVHFWKFFPYYVDSIDQHGLFDIVCIDGVWRDECTEKALQHLKPGGLLIIDNYKQKSADLEHWPLTEKLIEGMDVKYFKEPEHDDWVTIIVTKP